MIEWKETGGSVFPVNEVVVDGDLSVVSSGKSGGMTLRDWFAGQALAGRMARNTNYSTWEDAAMDVYEAADAMLKERNK